MKKEELEAIKRRAEEPRKISLDRTERSLKQAFHGQIADDLEALVAEVEKLQRLLCWWVDRAILPPDSSAHDAKIVGESRRIREVLEIPLRR